MAHILESGRCIGVLNPKAWLPSYGADSVIVNRRGRDLSLIIGYDSELDDGVARKELVFSSVCDFRQHFFLGPSVSLGPLDDYLSHVSVEPKATSPVSNPTPPANYLVEFPDSEIARSWNSYFLGQPPIRHFRMVVFGVDLYFSIFAQNFELKEV